MDEYFIGVDVGTRSVRAGLVNQKGNVIKTHVLPIAVLNPQPHFYEQSSEEIWDKVVQCVKAVTESVPKNGCVKGIGYDATCSLVVVDKKFQPLTISSSKDCQHNIVMWMDHRAEEETKFINSHPHEVLKYVGSKMSVEMQMPKLMWIKKHLPETWKKAAHFFDLPDFLTFKSTGKLTRSMCSLTCKWTYKWDDEFLKSIGLEDLIENNYTKIGNEVAFPGELCGKLEKTVADLMGLSQETCVGISILDAHAGGLGLLSSKHQSLTKHTYAEKLGLICGTSTCHMVMHEKPLFVPGVWGPYYGVMFPGLWLNEGGQSATGSVIDYVIEDHPALSEYPIGTNFYVLLEEQLELLRLERKIENISLLADNLHVYPDFHGNRSPLADTSYRGMFGTKDIIEQLTLHGYKIDALFVCGGLAKSELFLQTHADILDLPVFIPDEKESVILGSAILGASAANPMKTLTEISSHFGSECRLVKPNSCTKQFFQKKYAVFKKMQSDWPEYKNLMHA